MKLKQLLNYALLRPRVSRVALASLMFAAFSANAQTVDITVGTGTSTTSSVPIYSCYGYTYSQQIYTAADLQAAGFTAGATFTNLRFFYAGGPTNNSTDWTVYMGNTNRTAFGSNTDWEAVANLQQVYSGIVTYPGSNNWMDLTLSNTFHWDGVSNLIIAVDENQSGYNCSINWRMTTTTSNAAIYYRSDGTNPDPQSPQSATGRLDYVPNIQLAGSLDPACSGTPPSPTISVNPGNTICEMEDFSMSGTPIANSGLSYQWQHEISGTWTDIAGETALTYNNSGITANTNYRLNVTCTNSMQTSSSTPISMTVSPLPNVTVNADATSICPGDVASLTASGAQDYLWTPNTNLSANNTASVFAGPTTSTTYTVTGTDANGCSNTATSRVVPNAEVSADLQITPNEICSAGSNVSVLFDDVPSNSNGANWEYRILGPDGTTVIQNWNITNSYDFVPAQDSIYGYFYQLRNIACPGDYIDSIPFEILVGFGADVSVENYNCNNLGGSILLENVFGQQGLDSIYSNSLNAVTADMALAGSANITGGRAVLTASQTSINGSMKITVPNFQAGFNNALNVSFLLTMDQPINNYGTGGADGLAYCFSNDANQGANMPNGSGSKLRLVFDAADNSPNTRGIYLVYGNTGTGNLNPTAATTLAYSSNYTSWKLKTDVPVEMNIDIMGRVSVTVDGILIFDKVQLPASYQTEDVSTWTHFFSAGTGGDALRQAVSNFQLSANTIYVGVSAAGGSTPATWNQSAEINNLLPGTYMVWLSKSNDLNCSRNIATVTIGNDNPQVNLGPDTTICQGETLVLDAGNPGASYTWSNSNVVTQTYTVTNSGNYVAYVTGANGCVGVSSINVTVKPAPSASSIHMQGIYPNMNFTVLNPQNTTSYAWDFGDGVTLANGPASVSHTYWTTGNFVVTATLSNECGDTDVSQNFQVDNNAGLDELNAANFVVFPNPTSTHFTVQTKVEEKFELKVYDAAGSLIFQQRDNQQAADISVDQWEAGIYFVHVITNGQTSVGKVTVR